MKTFRTHVVRWQDGGFQDAADELAVEEPLEMRVGDETLAITMRTPGHDLELFAGFLVTEGLLLGEPLLRQDSPNRVTAAPAAINTEVLGRMQRYGTISSSCGVCGKASIENVHLNFAPLDDEFTISADAFASWTKRLEGAQPGFVRTGGVHAAAIFSDAGDLVVVREDVGRHNAVDKAIGHAHLRKLLPLQRHVLLVSGRASFEIVQKALGARIPIIAAVSAPSSLAVQFADASGQTLVAFVRPGRCNVYTHSERISAVPSPHR
jgi:FdhD protein